MIEFFKRTFFNNFNTKQKMQAVQEKPQTPEEIARAVGFYHIAEAIHTILAFEQVVKGGYQKEFKQAFGYMSKHCEKVLGYVKTIYTEAEWESMIDNFDLMRQVREAAMKAHDTIVLIDEPEKLPSINHFFKVEKGMVAGMYGVRFGSNYLGLDREQLVAIQYAINKQLYSESK